MQSSSVLMWKLIYWTDGKSYWLVVTCGTTQREVLNHTARSGFFLQPDKDPIKIEMLSVEILYVERCSAETTSVHLAKKLTGSFFGVSY